MAYREHRRDCPSCQSMLEPSAEGGPIELTCIGCAGTFVSYEVLRRRYPRIEAQLNNSVSAVPVRPLACPRCAEPMRRVGFETIDDRVALDFCNAHGVWFDRLDLEQLKELL